MIINLECCESVVIVVKYPTGVVYDIQCGGMVCDQEQVEGFILDSYPALVDILEMDTWRTLTDGNLKQIEDAIYKLHNSYYDIKVVDWDREKAKEAFVPCTIEYNGQTLEAVLTWENCD